MTRQIIGLVANHGGLGGGEVMVVRYAQTLRQLGHTPVIIAPDDPDDLMNRAADLRLDARSASSRGSGRCSELLSLRRAVLAFHRDHPDALLWAHGLGAACASWGLGNRVVHVHKAPEQFQHGLLRFAAWRATEVLTVSDDTFHHIRPSVQRRTHVMGNWTADMSPSTPRKRPAASANFRLGFLGRPVEVKGIEDLVVAMELLNTRGLDVTLELGGESLFATGQSQDRVEDALNRLGDRLHRRGWVDPREFFSTIDVLVCPSRWDEAFGLVAAEAMSAGVPVVVTRAGALPEVVGEEYPYMATRKHPEHLARVIHRACAELGTRRGERVVAAARRRWERWWSPAAGTRRVAAALERWELGS